MSKISISNFSDPSWISQRRFPIFELDIFQLKRCLQPLQKDVEIVTAELINKGLANTNYLLTFKSEDKLILRIHSEKKKAGLKEYNLSKLLSGTNKVPSIFYYGEDKIDNFNFSLIEYIDGKPLSELKKETEKSGVYYSLGKFLAMLCKINFQDDGLLDENLNIKAVNTKHTQYHPYINYILDCIENKNLLNKINPALGEKIKSTVKKYDEFLKTFIIKPYNLVHGDFKSENILVNKKSKTFELVGVIDWEHARSDSSLGDIATIFRGDYSFNSLKAKNFIDGYQSSSGQLLPDWEKAIKLIDLINLCSFLCGDVQRKEFYSNIVLLIEESINFLCQ